MIGLNTDGNSQQVSVDDIIREWRIDTMKVLLYTKYDEYSDLEEDWDSYMEMPVHMRRESDMKSIELTRESNISRYRKLRNGFLQQDIPTEIIPKHYSPVIEMYDYAKNSDDIVTKKEVAKYLQESSPIISKAVEDTIIEPDIPTYVEPTVPFFTPDEMEKLGVSYFEKTPKFSNTPSIKSICEMPIKEWYRIYKESFYGYHSKKVVPFYEWGNIVKKLSAQMESATGQELLNIKQSLLDLGWNPSIPYNDDSISQARQFMKSCLKERTPLVTESLNGLCVAQESTDAVKSINVIFFEHSDYGYERIGCLIENDFFEYQRNINKFGKMLNPPKDDMEIYTVCLPSDLVDKMKTRMGVTLNLPPIISSKSTIKNRPMVCQEFVTNLIGYTKADLRNISEGITLSTDYQLGKMTIALLHEGKFVDYTQGNHTVGEFVPITEVKELPVQFDDDGNLLISKGKDINFEGEYSRCHLAMMQYAKSKSVDGMEYCMTKLWYMNILLEDMIHDTKDSKEKSKLNKVRAKVMNDIKTYMPKILESDPQFDILKAYNDSPFADNKIKIRNSTIRYTIDAVKRLLKVV